MMRKTRPLRLSSHSRGFTVVELMIATAVFGMVLLIIATAILQLSRVYYKGITETKVQATTRTIVDTISQAIQFNGGNITVTPLTPTAGNSYAFCVGNTQYSYTTGYQLADTPTAAQTYHALVGRDIAGCVGQPAQNVRAASVTGRELLAPGMRVAKLQVTNPGGSYYLVSIRIVYGDDDLVYSPAFPADVNGHRRPDAACRNIRVGTQFCAVSDITAAVTKRVK